MATAQSSTKHQRNDQRIIRLNEHLREHACSVDRPPVADCLSDLSWFTETHLKGSLYLAKWKRSTRRSFARDQVPIKKIELLAGLLQRCRLPGIDPERTTLVEKLQRARSEVFRPVKVKPGETLRMEPPAYYYVDYKAELKASTIRLRTVEMPGRMWLMAVDYGMTQILAACIKGLVDKGFTAYKSGNTIVPGLLKVFYPSYRERIKPDAVLSTYRYRYVRTKKVVVNAKR